ncbi:hypothetical protein O6H91_10G089100 [Diphasiastrum complanatum]|uniref:Uncharacterized protein n=1 Tax=Diphasiastrum complanatum TaxID=34168 RepID=A0ACC2CJB8_DIPCM|nr:hypothetical protein O6H91_10G089100 [Diphasiastrum complanatum]
MCRCAAHLSSGYYTASGSQFSGRNLHRDEISGTDCPNCNVTIRILRNSVNVAVGQQNNNSPCSNYSKEVSSVKDRKPVSAFRSPSSSNREPNSAFSRKNLNHTSHVSKFKDGDNKICITVSPPSNQNKSPRNRRSAPVSITLSPRPFSSRQIMGMDIQGNGNRRNEVQYSIMCPPEGVLIKLNNKGSRLRKCFSSPATNDNTGEACLSGRRACYYNFSRNQQDMNVQDSRRKDVQLQVGRRSGTRVSIHMRQNCKGIKHGITILQPETDCKWQVINLCHSADAY